MPQTFTVLRLSFAQNIYVTSQICLSVQFPYYYSLNKWLQGVTNGNQEQTIKDF